MDVCGICVCVHCQGQAINVNRLTTQVVDCSACIEIYHTSFVSSCLFSWRGVYAYVTGALRFARRTRVEQ